MSDRARGALILGHNRQELLDQCIDAIDPQVDDILVIDNASDPALKVPQHVHIDYIPDQPPNLSKLWNHGLDWFAEIYDGDPWDVAVLCDDALVPVGWFDAVTHAMRMHRAVIGCSNPWNSFHDPIFKTRPDSDIAHRMPGWAWIMDGTRRIRAEERLKWWWLDTKLDFDARRAGGTVMISGYPVPNQQPNYYTNTKPELGQQAGIDGATFVEIEGSRPW